MRIIPLTVTAFAACFAAASLEAQTPGNPVPARPTAGTPPADVQPSAQQTDRTGLWRWLDLQDATLGVRYRAIEPSTDGRPTTSQMQTNEVFKARVLFDRSARLTLGVGVSSGGGFTGSWNDTGIGTGDHTFDLDVRHLFLTARPANAIELSYGSMPVARGESTEITTYDNDGYLTGARAVLKPGRVLPVDEITFTAAYLGDTSTPNAFERFDRLDTVNYGQLVVARSFTPRLRASVDLTRVTDVNTLRAGARIAVPEVVIADAVRVEQYTRFDKDDTRAGWALTAEKKLGRAIAATYGWADIDRRYGGLNADRFNIGRRVHGSLTLSIADAWSCSVFAQRAGATDFPIANQSRVDVVLSYKPLKDLRRAGWIR